MMRWFLRRLKAFRKVEAELSLAKLDMLGFQTDRDAAVNYAEETKAEALKMESELATWQEYYTTMEARVVSLQGMIHDHENTIGQLTAALNKKPARAKSGRFTKARKSA